jgi:GxxExxY protein
METLDRGRLLFPELSYQIIGSAFEVFKELGPHLKEKTYQKAFEEVLCRRVIRYAREQYVPIIFNGVTIGAHFLDFVIEDKIVAELKVGNHFDRRNLLQVTRYLQSTKYPLAIVINFTQIGVRQRRVLNPKNLVN